MTEQDRIERSIERLELNIKKNRELRDIFLRSEEAQMEANVDIDACRCAVDALRAELQRINPCPLTLTKLRGMVGGVVWCKDTDGIHPVLLCLHEHLLKEGKGIYMWALDVEGNAGRYDVECAMECGATFYRTKPEGSAE